MGFGLCPSSRILKMEISSFQNIMFSGFKNTRLQPSNSDLHVSENITLNTSEHIMHAVMFKSSLTVV